MGARRFVPVAIGADAYMNGPTRRRRRVQIRRRSGGRDVVAPGRWAARRCVADEEEHEMRDDLSFTSACPELKPRNQPSRWVAEANKTTSRRLLEADESGAIDAFERR